MFMDLLLHKREKQIECWCLSGRKFGVGEFRSRKDLGNYPDIKSEDISSTNEETGSERLRDLAT